MRFAAYMFKPHFLAADAIMRGIILRYIEYIINNNTKLDKTQHLAASCRCVFVSLSLLTPSGIPPQTEKRPKSVAFVKRNQTNCLLSLMNFTNSSSGTGFEK